MLSWRTPRPQFHGSDRHDDSYKDPNGGYIGGELLLPRIRAPPPKNDVFSIVFGYQSAGSLNLTFRGQAELAKTEYVSGDYFGFGGLGIPPATGRLIAPGMTIAPVPPPLPSLASP